MSDKAIQMAESLFSAAHAKSLLHDLRRANSEQAKKERFLQYLTRSFSHDSGAQSLISALALGAERTIANIPRSVRSAGGGATVGRGRADTQTETIIIEWEKDLSKTGAHAIDQLREYLAGNWKSGREYRFVLVATDGIRWRLYAPDWSHLKSSSFALTDEFELREVRRFDLSDESSDDFPFFLDEVLFVSRPKIATLERIEADFGSTSSAFINSMRTLKTCEAFLEKKSELKTAYEQWRKFLSIAYGRFDDSPGMFMVHTYLSVFAKLLAFSVVGKGKVVTNSTIARILKGTVFEEELLVERFVEDDFFHWVANREYLELLKPMFRELNKKISEYDFNEVKEDVLKGVYQELIDLETRHSLGEYFTPDWLCERIVDALPIKKSTRILDPACGSGSFMRAAIARVKKEHPDVTAAELAAQICGIDIHPLSVQIAKTTILLALGDLVGKAERPITLHIYLANSLLVPEETADLFKSNFKISIDNKVCTLNTQGLIAQDQFDQIITLCDELADRHKVTLSRDRFVELTERSLPTGHVRALPSQLYEIYRALKNAKDEGRDSIWKFILQNTYKPVFLKNMFDVVVGNPPWLTYADVSNADYQAELKRLSDSYHVTPVHKANMPHLEIAAIFLAHSVNYFLKQSGTLAFVLPRSFVSADQHENTSNGSVAGLRIASVWDLNEVTPLFRVPSCVFFVNFGGDGKNGVPIPEAGIEGKILAGRLPRAHMHWVEAKNRITEAATRWYYSQLLGGNRRGRSALTPTRSVGLAGSNAYADDFKQGATVVPRSFYFVEPAEVDSTKALSGQVINFKPSLSMLRDAKEPWKELGISGRMEREFIFRTAVAKNILPFCLVKPLPVVLPLRIADDGNDVRRFELVGHDELFQHGGRYASKWFAEVERLWDENKTDKAKRSGMTYLHRLDFQHGITEQNPSAKILVLYTASGNDATAAVVDRSLMDFPFVAEHKTYWCEVQSDAEAHFLCAFLNSDYANEQIKSFQSRGLFGPRDIHKTIVKLPFPRFDAKRPEHVALAALGGKCVRIAAGLLNQEEANDFDARTLGRMRNKIREHLSAEMEAMDIIVERLSTGKSEAAIRSAGRGKRKRRPGTLRLFD